MSSNEEREAERLARRNTAGRAKLEEFLASGHKQTEVAKKLGVVQSAIAAWVAGTGRPEPQHREALQVIAGIDPALWQTEQERQRIQKLRDEQLPAVARAS